MLVGLAALALYVGTMLPGLGGPEDTPKFQLLGTVLGTAHSPGYPLYVLVAHAFSRLPVASPAWRANFMSACFGAVTIGLLYLIIRRAGASRLSGVALALGAAAGRSFWWDALVAEVYTLAAALQAAAVLKLVDWSKSGRARDFFAAVVWASLALGNHLSIVAIVPVFVLFAALTDWRFAFRLKTMALTVAVAAAGLSSYLFIVIRTYQRAPHLESRISSFAEFWYVLRGGRFDDVMFKFDRHTLLTERLPAVLSLLRDELTWFGVALVLIGFGLAVRRAPRLAMLFGGGAVAAIALALNFDSDLKGFLVPAFVMAWPLAAFAVPEAPGRASFTRAAVVASTALAIAIPAWSVGTNFAHNNLRDDDYFGRYFSSLTAWVPTRAAFVAENYEIDGMLAYQSVVSSKRLIRAVRREVRPVEQLLEDGYRVFAFSEGADEVESLGFRVQPVELPGEWLADAIARRDRTIVAAGAWPGLANALGLAGGHRRETGSQLRIHHVIAVGPTATPLIVQDSRPVTRELSDVVSAPAGFVAESTEEGGGRIRVGELPVARTDSGIAVAVAARDGRLVHRLTFAPGDALRLPMNMSRLALFEVKGRPACDGIGHRRWTDVSSLTHTGAVRLSFNGFHPFDASMTLYVTARGPLRPVVSDDHGPGRPTLAVERYEAGDRTALERRLVEDGVPRPWPAVGSAVHRIEVHVNDDGESATMVVGLGERGVHVLARGWADRPEAWRAQVCEAQLPVLMSARQAIADLWVGSGAEVAFGAGWRGAEAGRDGPMRWMGDRRATVLAAIDHRAVSRLYLQVLARAADGTLTVTINGTALEPQQLRAGWQVVSWPISSDVWALGPNQMSLETTVSPDPASGDPDRRQRTIALRQWRVETCRVGSTGC